MSRFGRTARGFHRPPQIGGKLERAWTVAAMLCHAHHRGLERELPCPDCWGTVVRLGFRQAGPVIVQRPKPVRLVPVFWRREAAT